MCGTHVFIVLEDHQNLKVKGKLYYKQIASVIQILPIQA